MEKPKPNGHYNYGYSINKEQKFDNKLTTFSSDNINDLIHLEAPITEDSLIRSLHSRFLSNEYFVC